MSNYPPGPYQQPQVPPPPPPGQPRAPRQYSTPSAIVLAPFSPALWRDVGQRWSGIGLMYMLLLLAITWLLVMIRLHLTFGAWARDEAPAYVEQVPPITITDGVVTADVEQPYEITDPESGRVLAIIDTTGATTEPPPDEGLLLTESELIIRRASGRIETRDLSEVEAFSMDKNRVYGWLRTMRTWFAPLAYVVMVVVSLIGRLLLMVVLAALGLAFASGFNAKLEFPALMRLAAISMTPGIFLGTILSLLRVPDPCCVSGLVGIALAIGYMALTVRANAPSAPPPPQFPVVTPGGG